MTEDPRALSEALDAKVAVGGARATAICEKKGGRAGASRFEMARKCKWREPVVAPTLRISPSRHGGRPSAAMIDGPALLWEPESQQMRKGYDEFE